MIQRRNIMATQTSLVAQQVRIRQWAEQIRNCQNRPKGMDVETWCTQNNLTKANYYYRLRRVRQICLDQMQDTETTAFPYHLFHELGYKVSFHLASKIQELTLAVQILLWPNRTEESV